jgi:integrase
MASIRRKGSHWQVVRNVYEDGRRRQICRTFASYAEARKHCAKVELLEQRGVGSARITFGEYLTDWVETKRRTVEPNTLAGYVRHIGHILRHHIATLPLDRVDEHALERFYAQLSEQPAGRGKPLSPTSVRHVHAVAKNALGDAVRHRLIDTNPAEWARPPRGQTVKVAVPTPEQIGALLDDLDQRYPELVELAVVIIGLGLRRSEALGLRWQDVNWAERRITICQVVIEHNNKWSIRQGTKSQAGQRTISIGTAVVEALHRQQIRIAELRLKIGRHWQDHDLVFPDTNGGPRNPAVITKIFWRAVRRAGWPAHSSPVHSLRHAAASHALAQGVDLATISGRLGHSSPAITARVYLSADLERDQAAGEVMARIPRRKTIQ